jgi:serine protease Do
MKKNLLLIAGGVAGLGATLITLPGVSAMVAHQENQEAGMRVRVQRLPKVVELQRVQGDEDPLIVDDESMVMEGMLADGKRVIDPEMEQITIFDGDEGPSWLGVEMREVTAENAKELKLPAERGVMIGAVTPDSPAAKAGLKEKDVITEVNGQRVEGAAQFRRMIREIPAGRAVQLTVWREGRSQSLSATLGKSEELHRKWMTASPGAFNFRMPEVEIPDMPAIAGLGDELTILGGGRPRLGIDGEDISGQLGSFFGAPDGEGILVRSVSSDSPAEKGGLKAGDVITTYNGERVHTVGDLRQKMAAQSDAQTAKVGVLRNHSQVTVTVELPARTQKVQRKAIHRTNI